MPKRIYPRLSVPFLGDSQVEIGKNGKVRERNGLYSRERVSAKKLPYKKLYWGKG